MRKNDMLSHQNNYELCRQDDSIQFSPMILQQSKTDWDTAT